MDYLTEMMDCVRSKHPLVHHITNYVTVNDCANICICSGGSPVMTDEMKDIQDMSSFANAVVLNMGTLNVRTVESMLYAGRIAKENNVPVIFDPVGAGATRYRNEVAETIIKKVKPEVIKGNSGEISFLAGIQGGVRGVDAVGKSDVGEVISSLAEKLGCIVASTGVVDFVSDSKETYELSNGSPMQGNVSGTGCMLSSVIGSYVGANGVRNESVISAITAFNVAAEHATKECNGPGSFKVGLFDSLFNLKSEDLPKEAKIRRI